MNVKKVNYNPSFTMNLRNVKAAENMITTEEINALKNIFKKIGKDEDVADLEIGKRKRFYPAPLASYDGYIMKLKMKLNGIKVEQNLSQDWRLDYDSDLGNDGFPINARPFDIVRRWAGGSSIKTSPAVEFFHLHG